MAKYLISFPGAAMVVPDGEWEAVVRDSHAVIEEAKIAGVYVFGGGIPELTIQFGGLELVFVQGVGPQARGVCHVAINVPGEGCRASSAQPVGTRPASSISARRRSQQGFVFRRPRQQPLRGLLCSAGAGMNCPVGTMP
jgi:hypothetical protein